MRGRRLPPPGQGLLDRPAQGGRKGGRRGRLLISGAIAFISLAAGALGFFAFSDGGARLKALPKLVPEVDTLAQAAGFGLDQIIVRGHRMTSDVDVFAALELDEARSLASFDLVEVRERIEKLPWVATAVLRRIYPGQLEVTITERKPAAMWQRGTTSYLVDAGGRTLGAVDPKLAPPTLPRIAGEGAPEEMQTMLALVFRVPQVAQRLEVAERVGQRRWRLSLAKGVTIELPAEGGATALSELAGWTGLAEVLERGRTVIDLRAAGRMAVRSAGEPAPRAPASISDLLGAG